MKELFRMRTAILALLSCVCLTACGGSDEMMTPDAGPVCGDRHVDPGESCDDGNQVDDDECNNRCTRNESCGDGRMSNDELCDDGNNSSSDGCSANCSSDETCGNGIRDFSVGELCDDGNTMDGDGCKGDCFDVEHCANDTVDEGENCDDGNITRWDGCGGDCIKEQSFVFRTVQIAGETIGCDFSADGVPDNVFAHGIGTAKGLLDAQLETAVGDGTLLGGVSMMAVTDITLTNADSMSVAWLSFLDRDDDADNHFDGHGELYIDRTTVTGEGSPLVALAGSIVEHHVTSGPQDVLIPLPLGDIFPLDVRRAHFTADITEHGGDPRTLENASLCGVIPVPSLAEIPDLISLVTGNPPPACGGGASANLGEMLVGGAMPLGIRINPTQPDVDLDGDGLEQYEVLAEGEAGCQAVISACIDGDGTRIEGRSCVSDARMADGFSAALVFSGIDVTIRGTR